jgi:hypothetical protein
MIGIKENKISRIPLVEAVQQVGFDSISGIYLEADQDLYRLKLLPLL